MAEIDIKVDSGDLGRAIHAMSNRVKNIPMDLLGQMLVNAVDEMFETEGAAGTAGQWKPLRESTIARNPRRAGGQILQATGAMANIQVKEVSEYSVTVESPTAYAAWHLSGTKDMVARDFFALQFDKVLGEMGDLVLQEFAR